MTHLTVGAAVWFSEPLPQAIQVAREIERLGYDHVWYPNHKLHRDLYVGMTALAMATKTVRIGSFIADLYSLHPALVAAAIASIDELSSGRAILALGAGGANFKEVGLRREHPLQVVEEGIMLIRRLLRGETVTYQSERYSLSGARLQFPCRGALPLLLASRGNRMLELGGRLADGVMISTYATPDGIRHALHRVESGATSAGRSLSDVAITSRVDTCVSSSSKEAREAVKPMIARSLAASYPDDAFVHQAGLEIPESLEEIIREKNETQTVHAGRLVPDDFVDAFTWAGTVEEVARKVAAVVELGISDICILPQPEGEAGRPTVGAFMEAVVPRVRSQTGL